MLVMQATKAMVAEAIQLEQQRENAKDDETVALEAVDTDDDDEDEAEFESWRQRELGRIRCWVLGVHCDTAHATARLANMKGADSSRA